MVSVNLTDKCLDIIADPDPEDVKKMELIIDNLYKRIPLYETL